MRMRRLIVGVVSVVVVAIGVALIAASVMGIGSDNTATNSDDPAGFNVPEVGSAETTTQAGTAEGVGEPEDKTLKVTIPKLARVEDGNFPDAAGDDEEALKSNKGIHLKGTGFPWQEEANVYLAAHRLGYPNEPSWLAFWDLDKLENGDEVFVTDANGKKYTYRVFKEFVVAPTDLYVTEPIKGKNIVTLQTCTLPDYSQRLIVQAELVKDA